MGSQTHTDRKLIVISAPSGAGKNTLWNAVIHKLDTLKEAVTTTTRERREGERDGIEYNFVNSQKFEEMVKADAFYEHANVHGNMYGTSRAAVDKVFAEGNDCLLIIDVQGARAIKEKFPEAHLIFIVPPSLEALKERLVKRGAETMEVIERRVENARVEMAAKDEFDEILVNEDLNRAKEQLESMLKRILERSPA